MNTKIRKNVINKQHSIPTSFNDVELHNVFIQLKQQTKLCKHPQHENLQHLPASGRGRVSSSPTDGSTGEGGVRVLEGSMASVWCLGTTGYSDCLSETEHIFRSETRLITAFIILRYRSRSPSMRRGASSRAGTDFKLYCIGFFP